MEQDLWLKTAAAERLGVDESVLKQSLASFATITASRLSPGAAVAHQPGKGPAALGPGPPPAGAPQDLEQWAPEFEDAELKEILLLISECYGKEHGKLDHGFLVQRVERENLRQLICALTCPEEEGSGLSPDLLADHWRRDLGGVRRLED